MLSELGIKDPLDGAQIDADDFFTDWLITNYLQDEHVADGRYSYHNYPAAPEFSPTEKITDCPTDLDSQSIYQYGVNYIQIRCQGTIPSNLKARPRCLSCQLIHILENMPFSQTVVMNSDMSLTRKFDFSD